MHDGEFKECTESLVERNKKSEFEIIYSNVTEQESENVPDQKKTTVYFLSENSTEHVKSDNESANLVKKHMEDGLVHTTS
ncbi:MAG: putative nucleic acid-binding protein [Patiriisocius sp.]|jgi:predicted nucleic acid-binding protein